MTKHSFVVGVKYERKSKAYKATLETKSFGKAAFYVAEGNTANEALSNLTKSLARTVAILEGRLDLLEKAWMKGVYIP